MIRLCVWLPLHEWNLLWKYLTDNSEFDPYSLTVMTYSWIEKRMFMVGWYDYIAKKRYPILNGLISLSYEYELLVDSVEFPSSAYCSCSVLYNNEGMTLEEHDNYFVIESYVTSSMPVIIPNFLLLMQSVLSKKYNDFQFQIIKSDSTQKQTILFSKQVIKEEQYALCHWQEKYNLLYLLTSFSSVREDCVRIFNFQIAALNGSSNNSPTSSNLLEDMYRITSQI